MCSATHHGFLIHESLSLLCMRIQVQGYRPLTLVLISCVFLKSITCDLGNFIMMTITPLDKFSLVCKIHGIMCHEHKYY